MKKQIGTCRGKKVFEKEKKRPVNRITCRGVKGIYKDKEIEIQLGNTGNETTIKVNGKRMKGLKSIHISAKIDEHTTVQIEKLKLAIF